MKLKPPRIRVERCMVISCQQQRILECEAFKIVVATLPFGPSSVVNGVQQMRKKLITT